MAITAGGCGLFLRATIAIAFAAAASPPVDAAQPAAELGEIPLADVLEVLILDRQLIAIDARTGGQTVVDLRLEEEVLWTGTRGSVGLARTNQRLLAVAVGSAAWQETGWLQGEEPSTGELLGERVALAVTSRRAIGFDGGSGNLVESSLGPRERLLARSAAENVAVVVTDRRVMGLSPFVGGFFERKLTLADRFEALTTRANLATVTTNRRLLIFRAPTGSWEERDLQLR